MTPDQFFEAFVRGNYEDCQQYPGCVRRAFNAAVSASHLADHYFTYWNKHDQSKVRGFKAIGEFVEDLSTNTDGCFRDIRSISNAYKHLYTSIDITVSINIIFRRKSLYQHLGMPMHSPDSHLMSGRWQKL